MAAWRQSMLTMCGLPCSTLHRDGRAQVLRGVGGRCRNMPLTSSGFRVLMIEHRAGVRSLRNPSECPPSLRGGFPSDNLQRCGQVPGVRRRQFLRAFAGCFRRSGRLSRQISDRPARDDNCLGISPELSAQLYSAKVVFPLRSSYPSSHQSNL